MVVTANYVVTLLLEHMILPLGILHSIFKFMTELSLGRLHEQGIEANDVFELLGETRRERSLVARSGARVSKSAKNHVRDGHITPTWQGVIALEFPSKLTAMDKDPARMDLPEPPNSKALMMIEQAET